MEMNDFHQSYKKCAHVEKKTEKELRFIGEPISNTSMDLKKVSRKLAFQVSLSLVFFFIELCVGIWAKSVALVADSYHMISDVMALVVAFACLRLANKTTKSNTYGLVRMEAVGGLFNGLFLLTVCLSIFQEATRGIITAKRISSPLTVLAVGIIGLFINVVGLFLMHGGHGHSHGGHGHSHGGGGHGHSHNTAKKENGHGHSHDSNGHGHSHEGSKKAEKKKSPDAEPLMEEEVRDRRLNSGISLEKITPYNGITDQLLNNFEADDEHDEPDDSETSKKPKKEAKNVNIMGVYLHLLSDAIGSVIVIITSSIAHFYPQWAFCPYLDPVLSMCLACMMTVTSIQLICNASYILLRKSPRGFNVEQLEDDVKKINGVVTVNDVKAWPLTGSRIVASVRVLVCNPIIYPSVSKKIKILFHDNGCHSVSIEPTFEEECMQKINESI